MPTTVNTDRGFIRSGNFYGQPGYECLDRAVTLEEAYSVLDYPLEKRRLHVRLPQGHRGSIPVNAWAICRTDTNTVVCDAVGSKFSVLPNTYLLDFISENILTQDKELEIESVGTLNGGGTAFVNIVMDRFHVKGDPSETINQLMYYNPIGQGPYRVCFHGIRFFCTNVLRVVEAEGKANETLMKVSHTPSAHERISGALVDLDVVRLAAGKHRQVLDEMAVHMVTGADVSAFLGHMFPADPTDPDKTTAYTRKQRREVQKVFESDIQDLGPVAKTRYGLLNAYTYWNDNCRPMNVRTNTQKRTWDNITGGASLAKKRAYSFLAGIDA